MHIGLHLVSFGKSGVKLEVGRYIRVGLELEAKYDPQMEMIYMPYGP
jgi:hypothetical protein